MIFCTLFNSFYLTRGLALYHSLIRHEPSSILYVYCMDDITYNILEKLSLPGLLPVAIQEFESLELLAVKISRSVGEYCWTCTPFIILHALNSFSLTEITYLDADLYFFSSPKILLAELQKTKKSILITEHRFSENSSLAERFGKYCVQFMTFKADSNGFIALQWWADRCLEWCYAREENGKFGDQKYLDDWTTLFSGVQVMQHLGGGVAPWNIQRYILIDIEKEDIKLREICTNEEFNLIFYHFHGFKIFSNGEIDLSAYKLNQNIINEIYVIYIQGIRKAAETLGDFFEIGNFHGLIDKPNNISEILIDQKRRFFRRAHGRLNILKIDDLKYLR